MRVQVRNEGFQVIACLPVGFLEQGRGVGNCVVRGAWMRSSRKQGEGLKSMKIGFEGEGFKSVTRSNMHYLGVSSVSVCVLEEV